MIRIHQNAYNPLQNSWKNLFLDSHLQYMLNQIQLHEQHIIAIRYATTSKSIQQLNDATFWKDLTLHSSNSDEINALYQLWQKIKPLASLNSKQLLDLLQAKIVPLERHYDLAIKLLQKKKTQLNWFSKWFYPSLEHYLNKIQENQMQLLKLKSTIYDGLLWRCQAYRMLNTTSDVDDIVAGICHKINSFNTLANPLIIKTPYSATLNGDRRLIIYDYLHDITWDKDKLYEMTLAPVFKKGYSSFKKEITVKHELKIIRECYEKIIVDLKQDSVHFDWFVSFIPAPLGMLCYVLYMGITFIAYHYLSLLLQPLISMLLGTAIFNIIHQFLFYTLALSPIWLFSWNLIRMAKGSVYGLMTHRKKTQIYAALDALICNQEYIANHLSQVLIDIPQYDIQHTCQQIRKHQRNLSKIKQNLRSSLRLENYFCNGAIVDVVANVLTKIEIQEKQFITHLNRLANHIALRVSSEISHLQKLTDEQATLSVTMPKAQIENLHKYVATFGEPSAKETLLRNFNPIYKWITDLDHARHPFLVAKALHPWGGAIVRKDYLNGWETILKHYLPDKNKRDAALQINSLLAGKCLASKVQLEKWIEALDIGCQKTILIQKLQTHLFTTLNVNTAASAALFDEQHRALIFQWHHENKPRIKEAQFKLKALLTEKADDLMLLKIEDKDLCELTEFLEGQEIYHYSSTVNNDDINYKKLATDYFERYQGQTSKAIKYLRFFSEEEQTLLLINIARKRLSWLLLHLPNEVNPANPFDETDIELFYDYRLVAETSFEFTTFILNSFIFNRPWDQHIETFLDACQSHGLDSGKLLKRYKAIKHSFQFHDKKEDLRVKF
ncbi:MAG: hypothetical protein JSS07_04100 [Proteobacteria bacterium]|nr:hypothetical protein [Pseudomonadota bacterium]